MCWDGSIQLLILGESIDEQIGYEVCRYSP